MFASLSGDAPVAQLPCIAPQSHHFNCVCLSILKLPLVDDKQKLRWGNAPTRWSFSIWKMVDFSCSFPFQTMEWGVRVEGLLGLFQNRISCVSCSCLIYYTLQQWKGEVDSRPLPLKLPAPEDSCFGPMASSSALLLYSFICSVLFLFLYYNYIYLRNLPPKPQNNNNNKREKLNIALTFSAVI